MGVVDYLSRQANRGLAEDFANFRKGDFAEKTGAVMNAAASLPRYAASAANEAVVKPVRGAVAEFGTGMARGAGLIQPGGEPNPAAQSGIHPPELADDGRNRERAFNDPMSGNPFIDKAYDEMMDKDSQGGAQDFMQRTDGSYVNGHKVTGDWGAPGSSGMPGPGGTVSTISAENFVKPGGKLAGDAAAGRARRDFQLRQEGNAHLASDATPEEIQVGKLQSLRQQLQNVDLSGGQSLTSLAANRNKARRLQGEIDAVQAGAASAASSAAEARENALDRRSEERIAAIENMPGLRDLKVGGTMEGIKNKLVRKGYPSLTPEENFLLTNKIRQDVISDLQRNYGEATEEQVAKQMDMIMGQLREASEKAGESADESTDKLTSASIPDRAMTKLQEAAKQGKGIRYQGKVYKLDENGNAVQVNQ